MNRLRGAATSLKTRGFFLLNYNVIGITEKWWTSLQTRGGCDGRVLSLQERPAGKMRGQGACCLVKEQPGYKEFFSEMDDGLVESLWVRERPVRGISS